MHPPFETTDGSDAPVWSPGSLMDLGNPKYDSRGRLAIPDWQPYFQYNEPLSTPNSTTSLSTPGLESSFNPFDQSFGAATAAQKWETWDDNQTPLQTYDSVNHINNPSWRSDTTSSGLHQPSYQTPSTYLPVAPPFYQGCGYDATSPVNSRHAIQSSLCIIPSPTLNFCSSSMKRESMPFPDIPTPEPLSKTKNAKTTPGKYHQRPRVSEHGSTEKRYRGRMNNEFTALHAALPKDLSQSQNRGMDMDSRRSLSKINILDLAKKHIATMEREQVELEDEGQSLQSQMEFFKSMFVSCGGQLMP